MRAFAFFVLCFGSVHLYAQSLPTHEQIFKAIYKQHFEIKDGDGIWHCPEALQAAFNDCADDSAPTLTVLKSFVVEDDGEIDSYVLTSAYSGSDCHSCAPLLGMAVFEWKADRWVLKSARSDATRFGAWSQPPDVTLVQVGPHIYGFMLSLTNGGQGYMSTECELLALSTKSIGVVWQGIVGEDNSAAFDPTDPMAAHRRVLSKAAYRFDAQDPNAPDYDAEHYDLTVVSRGIGYGGGTIAKSQNWTQIYRWKDGAYKLLIKPQVNKAGPKKQ